MSRPSSGSQSTAKWNAGARLALAYMPSCIHAVVAVSDRAPYTGGRLEAIDEQEDANWAGGAGGRRDPAVETLDRLEPVESFIEIVRRIESVG